MPSSRCSFLAAKSKRAACASQGLVSCSRVRLLSGPFIRDIQFPFFSITGTSDSVARVAAISGCPPAMSPGSPFQGQEIRSIGLRQIDGQHAPPWQFLVASQAFDIVLASL